MKKADESTSSPKLNEIKQSKIKDELKEAFDLFDVYETGKIDIKEILSVLTSLGYHQKKHALFNVLQELDTPEHNKFGVTYEKFVEFVGKRISDLSTPNAAQNVFDMFIDDKYTQTLSLTALKRICREIDEPITDHNINEMIEKAATQGIELNFKEFYNYLLNKA